MRLYWLAMCGLLTACIPTWNRWTAAGLAEQLPAYEEEVVFDNLKAFYRDPEALPFQLILTGANTTASTTGGFGENYTAAVNQKASLLFNPTWTGTDQGGFTLVPVTDPDDIDRLQALYNFAWPNHRGIDERLRKLFRNYPPPYQKNASGGPALCYLDHPASNSQREIININNEVMKSSKVPAKEKSSLFLSAPSGLIPNCEDSAAYVYDLSSQSLKGPLPVGGVQSFYESTMDKSSNLGLILSSPFKSPLVTGISELLPGLEFIMKIDPGQSCPPQWNRKDVWYCIKEREFQKFVKLVMAATPNTSAATGGGGGGGGAGGGGGGGGSGSGGGRKGH